MTTNINSGWLKNEDGKLFAPSTLVEKIQNKDGKSLQEIIDESGGSAQLDPAPNNIIKKTNEGLLVTITDDSITEIKFGVDANGNYGYYKAGADTLTPFKSGGSGGEEIISGEFTSAGTRMGTVHIDLGFKPKILFVMLPFSNGPTWATYLEEMNDYSLWTIPQENNGYKITFNLEYGETGISKIDDNGFTFRSNADNTLNKNCVYYTVKESDPQPTPSGGILAGKIEYIYEMRNVSKGISGTYEIIE